MVVLRGGFVRETDVGRTLSRPDWGKGRDSKTSGSVSSFDGARAGRVIPELVTGVISLSFPFKAFEGGTRGKVEAVERDVEGGQFEDVEPKIDVGGADN